METMNEGGNKEFAEFLKGRPTLAEATSGRLTVVTGQVFQTAEGKVAIATGDGQTMELDAAAVERFKVVDTSDIHPTVQLHVATDALSNAVVKPIKPIFKETIKEGIKDPIGDGTIRAKDIATDPQVDKLTIKDLRTDPIADKSLPKDFSSDPVTEKALPKDVGTDGAWDPIDTGPADVAGTGVADSYVETPGQFDPGSIYGNPAYAVARGGMAAGQAGMTPFVMATPHQAPAHLVDLQVGMQPGLRAATAATAATAQTLKPLAQDTAKETVYETAKEPIRDTYKEVQFDTRKELQFDTIKELQYDTYKEMVAETWVEGGPYTAQEGTLDPGGIATQPVWNFPGLVY